MDLDVINAHISEHRVAMLASAVDRLGAAVDSRSVPNKLFTETKSTINLAVSDATDEFNRRTRDWTFEVLVMGAYNVPAAYKAAVKRELTGRAAFLSQMLPLHELLQSAKPFIVKRASGDQAMSAAITKRSGDQGMSAAITTRKGCLTCQCCGRQVFAQTGFIAHHGYRRPTGSWQTASCFGARHLPFEADRNRLAELIVNLRESEAEKLRALNDVAAELASVVVMNPDRSQPLDSHGRRPIKRVPVTRETFDSLQTAGEIARGIPDFDHLMTQDIGARKREIDRLRAAIDSQVERYEGWRQTHAWDASNCRWTSAPSGTRGEVRRRDEAQFA